MLSHWLRTSVQKTFGCPNATGPNKTKEVPASRRRIQNGEGRVQYSSGSKIVVALRSASVMIQNFTPVVSL
jgi:hypothetical protein